ncbi:MAG: nickel pincer cofactor biosynthesis protein LarB [Oligoflexia bacterium]|nr:nickel pincer cofactor biosynthesis protein LarB [Oligoflexia bacterium]
MKECELLHLLKQVKNGERSVEGALEELRQLPQLPYEDLGFAKIDNHRELRTGHPEVIFCQGKSVAQIKLIAQKMNEHQHNILGTRASEEVFLSLKKDFTNLEYYPDARIIFINNRISNMDIIPGIILVVSAGTADLPVAEEAAITAEKMGNQVERLYDVGVAGIHRLLFNQSKLYAAQVIIVVAGMEGALASVVGGMVDRPVIGVPTSVGYGTNFGGVSALLTMLNSCASGIGVVNIDNGFGAAFLAAKINRQIAQSGVRIE